MKKRGFIHNIKVLQNEYNRTHQMAPTSEARLKPNGKRRLGRAKNCVKQRRKNIVVEIEKLYKAFLAKKAKYRQILASKTLPIGVYSGIGVYANGRVQTELVQKPQYYEKRQERRFIEVAAMWKRW
ncbi:hypothetical protein AVEN_225850-1 [Araneus ventricosus]|uniref:Uncharacterized protein n=1 Tax=Araneus ventricosus TaxID=182803 RepID=A0A4Y2BAT4_ARAVE|nr:hypothetical protein AVEN_225850-1 [Araneus ventricosus]